MSKLILIIYYINICLQGSRGLQPACRQAGAYKAFFIMPCKPCQLCRHCKPFTSLPSLQAN